MTAPERSPLAALRHLVVRNTALRLLRLADMCTDAGRIDLARRLTQEARLVLVTDGTPDHSPDIDERADIQLSQALHQALTVEQRAAVDQLRIAHERTEVHDDDSTDES